jgi:hypothetical protein
VHQFNRPDISLQGPDAQSLIMVITCSQSATVRTRPCYESFQRYFERRLQLTVRTLGQAVQTPSGILVITFYSNIGLGRNQHCWKAKKKFCKLNVRTTSVRTEIFARSDGPAKNSRITFRTRKTWPVRTAQCSRPDPRASNSVFDSILGFQSL